MPDPRRVAKRINSGRAPARHRAAPVTLPAPPRCRERWARRGGLLPIVLQRGGGRWPGSGRVTEEVLCQAVTAMGTLACTKPCRFDPAGSLWVPGKTRRRPPNVRGVRSCTQKDKPHVSHAPEDVTARVPHPWLCHHVSCTPAHVTTQGPRPLATLPHVSCSWKVSPDVTPEYVTAQPAGTDGSREPGLGFGNTGLGWACGSLLLGDTPWCKGP